MVKAPMSVPALLSTGVHFMLDSQVAGKFRMPSSFVQSLSLAGHRQLRGRSWHQ